MKKARIEIVKPKYYQPKSEGDPIRQDSQGWYFWDETWSEKHGPYCSETSARAALKFYAEEML